MALFGEKYPDIVRVVKMGDYSRELCGGTHLDNVGQVGLFKIVGEESVAAGTRRITALVGKSALEYVRQEEEILGELSSQLRVPASQIGERVNSLIEEVKTLKKQVSQRRSDGPARITADDLARRGARLRRRGGDRSGRRKRDAGRDAAVDRRDEAQARDGPGRPAGCGIGRESAARRRIIEGFDRSWPARGQLAQGGRARGRRRRRRPARPGAGGRKITGEDPCGTRKGTCVDSIEAGIVQS